MCYYISVGIRAKLQEITITVCFQTEFSKTANTSHFNKVMQKYCAAFQKQRPLIYQYANFVKKGQIFNF